MQFRLTRKCKKLPEEKMRETEIIMTFNALIELLQQEIKLVKERRIQELTQLFEKKEKLVRNFMRAKDLLKTEAVFSQNFIDEVYKLNTQLDELIQESQAYYDVTLEVNRRIIAGLSDKILSGTRLKQQYNQCAKIKYDNIHRPASLSLNEKS